MEEAHRVHKEAAWGWVNALADLRRRARVRLRKSQRVVTTASR